VIAARCSSLPEIGGDAHSISTRRCRCAREDLTRVVSDRTLREDLAARGRSQAAKFTWDVRRKDARGVDARGREVVAQSHRLTVAQAHRLTGPWLSRTDKECDVCDYLSGFEALRFETLRLCDCADFATLRLCDSGIARR